MHVHVIYHLLQWPGDQLDVHCAAWNMPDHVPHITPYCLARLSFKLKYQVRTQEMSVIRT